jgi:pimeloyl-ACP methyl ester carboxylesterase
MRWGRAAVAGGAAVGAAAAYNAAAKRGVQPLANLLGGVDGTFVWRGHRVAYTRHGDGPPLLLVHSIHVTAWCYEWRRVIEMLAERFTVYVPDLLGFGRSDRPAIAYSAQSYLALLADFAERVIRQPCAIVGSSLSGSYAIALAARDPSQFERVVAVAPTGTMRIEPSAGSGALIRASIDLPVVGSALFNAMVSRSSLRRALLHRYADTRRVTESLLDIHYQTAHQPGARHAPAAFVGQRLNLNVREDVRRLRQPLLLIWGEAARQTSLSDAHPFRAVRPDTELMVIRHASDSPQEEAPEEFCDALMGFLASAPQQQAATTGVGGTNAA